MAPMSSIDLSDDQRFALMKLRRNIADVKQPHHDDHFLLRWLRARNFDPEAAEKMLRDSLAYRERWEVDTVGTWEPPEVIQKYYPCGLSGFDKDGAPVVIVPFAGLDIWGMLHSAKKSDFIRNTIKIIEHILGLAQEQGRKYGQKATQVVAIIDMENFNLRQYAWRPAGEVIITLIQMYEANYPEVLKACYIINAPKVFSIAFSVVKNFLKEYTLSKIQIIKNDPNKWKPLLLNVIEADQLPKHWGGTMVDSDGNARCPTKVAPGGKIPKTYYFKSLESLPTSNFSTAVVKKGSKLKLPYIVPQEGYLLKWEFKTDDHDIGFGVLCTDIDGKETEAIPFRRVSSNKIDEVGVITCPAPATYVVVFDNSYSIIRNKKLHYSIAIVPPLESKETELVEGND